MKLTYRIVAFGCLIFQGTQVIARVPSEEEAIEWIADYDM